ncbi:MAG: hypothetical protein R6U15_06510 [Candidatus Izemoplasmatales bacterium]
MYKRGIIGNDTEIKCRRLDFNQPYTILKGEDGVLKAIGTCSYSSRQHIFKDIKLGNKKRKPKAKQYRAIDYLRAQGKVQFRG